MIIGQTTHVFTYMAGGVGRVGDKRRLYNDVTSVPFLFKNIYQIIIGGDLWVLA